MRVDTEFRKDFLLISVHDGDESEDAIIGKVRSMFESSLPLIVLDIKTDASDLKFLILLEKIVTEIKKNNTKNIALCNNKNTTVSDAGFLKKYPFFPTVESLEAEISKNKGGESKDKGDGAESGSKNVSRVNDLPFRVIVSVVMVGLLISQVFLFRKSARLNTRLKLTNLKIDTLASIYITDKQEEALMQELDTGEDVLVGGKGYIDAFVKAENYSKSTRILRQACMEFIESQKTYYSVNQEYWSQGDVEWKPGDHGVSIESIETDKNGQYSRAVLSYKTSGDLKLVWSVDTEEKWIAM